MCREAVAQRVRSDPLGDLRGLRRIDDDAMAWSTEARIAWMA
jgi:hypothetical protein